jgi:hypothetical protein
MKNLRIITLVLVLAIAFSVWAPTPVLAKPADSGAASMAAKPKVTVVDLSITNQTGGPLMVTMVGDAGTFSFSAPVGKSTHKIAPGKYTVTLVSYVCHGSATKTRTFTSSKGNLGTWKCRK